VPVLPAVADDDDELLLDAALELEVPLELDVELENVETVVVGTAATLDIEFAFLVALLETDDVEEAVAGTTSVDVLCVVTTATVVDSSVVCAAATVAAGTTNAAVGAPLVTTLVVAALLIALSIKKYGV